MHEIRLAGGALDGLRLAYLDEGRGPATVLVHGLGGFAESWRYVTAALAARSRVLALDLPGSGRSDKPAVRYRVDFLAAAVRAFADALGLERVRLVGHSMGGAVVARVATAAPERVERLALIAAAVPGVPFEPSMLFRLAMLPGLAELAGRFLTPRLCVASVARCFAEPNPAEARFFALHDFAERTSPAARAAWLSVVRSARADFTTEAPAHRARLARLDVPTLVAHGRQDPVVPPAHAAALAALIPGAALRWLDHCGHFPQVECPASLNNLLADFLFAPAPAR